MTSGYSEHMDDSIDSISRTLSATLVKAVEMRTTDFSGLGIVMCDKSVPISKFFVDMRPNIPCPKVRLGDEACAGALVNISDRKNPLHDGFILFNEEGMMLRAAQYFSPPIAEKIIPNEQYGARHMTAQYGSLIDGVVLTAVVSHERKCFIFCKGKGMEIAAHHIGARTLVRL